eukprot:6180206-Pleurochrysis_carterae.AAC.1
MRGVRPARVLAPPAPLPPNPPLSHPCPPRALASVPPLLSTSSRRLRLAWRAPSCPGRRGRGRSAPATRRPPPPRRSCPG